MKNIHIIGISGGPGAGKSIFTGYAANILTNAGYGVYIVPEAASLLIEAGEKPGSVAFQIKVFTKILKLEASALQEAMMNNSSAPLFILCDRTLLDGNAYCTDEEFLQIATDHGMTLRDICAYYDTILYLETTAKGAPGFYGKQNNKVRYENMQEAKETCIVHLRHAADILTSFGFITMQERFLKNFSKRTSSFARQLAWRYRLAMRTRDVTISVHSTKNLLNHLIPLM